MKCSGKGIRTQRSATAKVLGQEGVSGRVSPGGLREQSERARRLILRQGDLGLLTSLLEPRETFPHKQNSSRRDTGFGPADKCSCKLSRCVLGKFVYLLSSENAPLT